MLKKYKICIIGLGYVGLPLAMSLSRHFKVVGFDNNHSRISELKKDVDSTKEIKNILLKKSKILFTDREKNIKNCNIYIIITFF